MARFPLSGGCGYCLSNKIACDAQNGTPCLTCSHWKIRCPPVGGGGDHLPVDICQDENGLSVCDHEGLEDVDDVEEDQMIFARQTHPLVHYMKPLDSLISTAHDVLLGPRIPSPYNGLLPLCFEDLPPHIPLEDVQYLVLKGAFTVPDTPLRNELLNTFVVNVHPGIPLLDLADFLQPIAINDGQSRVSLLLFHAVMFSSVAFIEPEHLYRAGYSSRKEARTEFFRKARVLYDFDVEADRVVLMQAALLMTYWHETPDDPKDFHYWLEIALSIATSMGLQPVSDPSDDYPGPTGLWKRLWWCVYTRDHLNAINLRRPPIIREEGCSVALPTLLDFEIRVFPKETTQMLGSCKILQSPQHQKHLAQIFIEKARLCTVISRILRAESSTSSQCDHLLEVWHMHLPPEVQYQPPSAPSLPEVEKPLFVHRAWLNMIFLAASSALHRHQTSRKVTNPSISVESLLRDLSRSQVQDATQAIATVAEGLGRVDAIHYLPTTTVGMLLPVLTIHILTIRSGQPDTWVEAFWSFYQCMKVLEQLGEVYASAESMASFFKSTVCGDQSDAGMPALLKTVLTSAELECFGRLVREGGKGENQGLPIESEIR